MVNFQSQITKMLDNIKRWNDESSLEEAIAILEEHTYLMNSYQMFTEMPLKETEITQIKLLVSSVKDLMIYLNEEKLELIDKIGQLNQSNKMATQYIKQFSESYFVDKDF